MGGGGGSGRVWWGRGEWLVARGEEEEGGAGFGR
jgi:hypothetical protein